MAFGYKLLYIPDSWVAENITIGESIVTVKNTLRDCGLGKVYLSEPSSLSMIVPWKDTASFQVKGAVLTEQGVAGYRLISREAVVSGKKQKVNAYCYLADLATGIPFALIDERTQYVTRTGVMTAVGLQILSNKFYKKLVLVGTGRIAFTTARAALECLEIRELVIVARRKASGEAFMDRIQPYVGEDITVSLAYHLQETVQDADMVVMATSAITPILYPHWLPEGITVCAVGGGQELASEFGASDFKIIIDDFDWCRQAGSICAWLAKGIYKEEEIRDRVYGSIAAVASGQLPGRENRREKILLIMQGMASLDIAMGLMTYKKARESSEPKLQWITL